MNQIIYAGKHLLTYSVSRHMHSSWEFIYCTGGEGRLSFDNGSLTYQEGDLVVIPPMIFHQNEGEKGFTNIHLNMIKPSLKIRKPTAIPENRQPFFPPTPT